MEQNKNAELREHVRHLLQERGIYTAEELSKTFAEDCLHSAILVINRWDERDGKTTGLLLKMLEEDLIPGYKPASERGARGSEPPPITARLIESIRAGCSTPDGIDREEARGMYSTVAKARGVPVDKLIDMAMGESWHETQPHPAKDPENPQKQADYEAWVAGNPLPSRRKVGGYLGKRARIVR